MLSQKNLIQNGYIELIPSRQRSNVVSLATSADTSATAVFVVQIEGITGEFVTIGLLNAITQLPASNLTGASQYGWTDIPGAQKVRVTRTDATGGNGTVGASLIEA